MTATAQTITGHRGAAGLAPENTLSSVRKALDLGVNRVEVDVQQTKDGVVICLHDRTLDRTTDMHGPVKSGTWQELKTAKANVGFEKDFPNESVPTLEDVIQLVNGQTELVIEIKDGNRYYPGIESRVAALIEKYAAWNWALVHTFNDEVLYLLHEQYPRVRLQKLFVFKMPWLPVMLDFSLHWASLDDYPFVEAFSVHQRFITQEIVERAHALGKKIYVWTVNAPDQARDLMDMGVDGIITDRPDIIRSRR